MKKNKPTYEELELEVRLEREIKNSLYYFITVKRLLSNYQAFRMINGTTQLNEYTDRMNLLLRVDQVIALSEASRNEMVKIDYNINPN